VASEFVLVLPVFFLIVLATTDLVRVFRAQIRMEMVAVQIGQIVSQCPRITEADFTDGTFGFWAHAGRIGAGLVDINTPTGGAMIVSAMSLDGAANRLDWQRRTGNASTRSAFGTAGAPTPILRGRDGTPFTIPTGQTLMATEVFAVIVPWTISAGLIGTALPAEIQGVSFFLSRASDPARLQVPPATPAPPAPPRECTA
jgi:Flp pilus assembly protein TadG